VKQRFNDTRHDHHPRRLPYCPWGICCHRLDHNLDRKQDLAMNRDQAISLVIVVLAIAYSEYRQRRESNEFSAFVWGFYLLMVLFILSVYFHLFS